MKPYYLPCLVMVCIGVGCSKQEPPAVPVPAPTNQVAAAAPAPATSPAVPKPQDASTVQNAVKTTVATPVDSVVNAVTNQVPATTPKTSVPQAVTPAAVSLADLTSDQVTQGLKEALGKGVQQAVAKLGTTGGFLTNLDVKIPMPDKLQTVEKAARQLGQGAAADEFIATMNHAAEQAVPVAAAVFADSVKQMSVQDAKAILSGPDDAATQYFRRTTQADLTQKFLPIVKDATSKAGVTAAYKKLTDTAGMASTLSPILNTQSLDVDSYVTGKAMDGLFKMVAEEEKRIRSNPVARSTDLLKSVFGAIGK